MGALNLHRLFEAFVAASIALMVLSGPSAFAQPKDCATVVAAVDVDWISNGDLERCAAAGDRAAEALLGMMYWGAADSELCDEDGCKLGDPEKYGLDSALTLDQLQANGRKLLESAGDKGDAHAQNELGLAFLDGLYGAPTDYVVARTWLVRSTHAGDEIAPYNLARIYLAGLGVEPSPVAAESFLRLSATRKYRPGRCSLIALLDRQPTLNAWIEKSMLWLTDIIPSGPACYPDEIMSELY